jgi:esterase FrsA
MTYLEELKDFSRVHILSQPDAAALERTLAAIQYSDYDGPGGWTYEWNAKAWEYTRDGRELEAIQCLDFARFPFPSSRARAAAHSDCVERFSTWMAGRDPRVKRIEITVDGRRVPIYARIDDPKRPVLIAIGGIATIKEQWHRLLIGAGRLGFSAAIAECPGVGENLLRYAPGCHGFIGAMLDEFSRATGTCRAYVVGFSFGGYLAIAQALEDSRIRGITAVGAPLSEFYTDAAWWSGVSAVTKRTLAHVCRVAEGELPALLPRFALSAAAVQSLAIPLHYVCSTRDEMVPPAERAFVEANARHLDRVVFDDVHGSANQMAELQKYIRWSVLAQSGAPMSPVKAMVTLNLQLSRLARGFRTYVHPRPATR